MAETPCLEVNLDLDPLHADHQLQQALHLNASRDDLLNTTTPSAGRKHSRSSSNLSDTSAYSDFSDESGKFDDADEVEYYENNEDEYGNGNENGGVYGSPHSAKRRRSNDWPAEARKEYGQGEKVKVKYNENTGSFGRRWRNRKNGPSPRATGATTTSTTATSNSKSPAPRGRRSRFVEGTMNDSVSEKPPSIYLRDDLYVQQQQQHQHQHHPYQQHEKTASIGASNHSHKSSGIFRFGKAIASAFNPFGGWGSVSEAWKGGSSGSGSGSGSASTDGNYNHSQKQEDDIARVQKAYEELKKSGFKGTVKGAYMQGAHAASASSSNILPDQTWKSIQAKMDYTPGRSHSRQISGESHDSTNGGSIRTSLQELRRAKSSLGISSVIKNQESDSLEVRKQKSRKDLLRQAKLLKKVSNLEDKLERARRELRELQGHQDTVPPVPKGHEWAQAQMQVPPRGREEQQPLPAQQQQQEPEPEQIQVQDLVPLSASEQAMALDQPHYPKKFVPGTLPTLPSERTLENRAEAEDNKPADTAATGTGTTGDPLQPLSPNISRDANLTTTPQSKETKQQSASLAVTTDSPSLKRKSPDPESLEAAEALDFNQDNNSTSNKETPSTTTTPSKSPSNSTSTRTRRAKLQKMGKSDSPGSVERKQSRYQSQSQSRTSTPSGKATGTGRRKPCYLNPTSPRSSPSARRSRSRSKSASASPRKVDNRQARLKTKKGYADLASASAVPPSGGVDVDMDMEMDMDSDMDADSIDYDLDSSQQQEQNSFYLQGEQHLNPDSSNASTPTRTPSKRRSHYEYIPPVPPLPKDLAATAAKVDRRLAKELGRRKSGQTSQAIGTAAVQHGQSQTQAKTQVEVQVPVKDDFEWPEGIF